MEYYDPFKIIEDNKDDIGLLRVFCAEYIIYLETLNCQVFKDLGYELVCVKKDKE